MPENKKKTRGNLAVMGRLVGLVKPLTPVMVAAVLLGVAGFLCAIFITVLGAYALLDSILPGMPISLGTVCLLLPSRAAIILSPLSCWPSSGIRSSARCASWPRLNWRAATAVT